MDSKNKNILIGGLLAIVLVMAVGYAAFATQLRINGQANITSSWNVHFKLADGDSTGTTYTVSDPSADAHGIAVEGGVITGATTQADTVRGTAPTGTISYSADMLTATIGATLHQPGDKVTYTLTPINEGSITAVAGTPVIKVSGSTITNDTAVASGNVVRIGNIQYTVNFTKKNSIAQNVEDNPITVIAEFMDPEFTTATVGNETAYLQVTLQYTQATATSA